jgi:hypothetical protein
MQKGPSQRMGALLSGQKHRQHKVQKNAPPNFSNSLGAQRQRMATLQKHAPTLFCQECDSVGGESFRAKVTAVFRSRDLDKKCSACVEDLLDPKERHAHVFGLSQSTSSGGYYTRRRVATYRQLHRQSEVTSELDESNARRSSGNQ